MSGRLGVTDAELMEKAFAPVFTAEDLHKQPNFNAIATVMMFDMPTSPFTMKLIPPMGESDPELMQRMREYALSKYGRPRAEVEAEIDARLAATETKPEGPASGGAAPAAAAAGAVADKPKESFLDSWLRKKAELDEKAKQEAREAMAQKPVEIPTPDAESVTPAPQIMNNHSGRTMPTEEDKSRPALQTVIPNKEMPERTQPVKKNIEPLNNALSFEETPTAEDETPTEDDTDIIDGGSGWVAMASQNAATETLESNKLAEDAKNPEESLAPMQGLKIHHEEHVLKLEHKKPVATPAAAPVQVQQAVKPVAPSPQKQDGVTVSHGDDGTTVRWR